MLYLVILGGLMTRADERVESSNANTDISVYLYYIRELPDYMEAHTVSVCQQYVDSIGLYKQGVVTYNNMLPAISILPDPSQVQMLHF